MRVFGTVNSAPGFDRHPPAINGFLPAIAVAGPPIKVAVEVEAEVTLTR